MSYAFLHRPLASRIQVADREVMGFSVSQTGARKKPGSTWEPGLSLLKQLLDAG
jgi:hypothetical protein